MSLMNDFIPPLPATSARMFADMLGVIGQGALVVLAVIALWLLGLFIARWLNRADAKRNAPKPAKPGNALEVIPQVKVFPLYDVRLVSHRPSSGGYVGSDGWWVED